MFFFMYVRDQQVPFPNTSDLDGESVHLSVPFGSFFALTPATLYAMPDVATVNSQRSTSKHSSIDIWFFAEDKIKVKNCVCVCIYIISVLN